MDCAATTNATENLVITGALDLDGAATGLGTLSVSGTSNLGASVTSSGTQSFGTDNSDLTTLSANTVVLTAADADIDMRSIDGNANNLTFNTGSGAAGGAGAITVNGDVTDIAILTLTDSGGATFNGSVDATTVTISDQNADDDTVIFNDTLTATTLKLLQEMLLMMLN